jgi:hypothetical protein
MRLWGKIRGTNQDYFIAEGQLADGGEAEGGEEGGAGGDADPTVEARGTGVNKFVYWAINNPMGEWT